MWQKQLVGAFEFPGQLSLGGLQAKFWIFLLVLKKQSRSRTRNRFEDSKVLYEGLDILRF